LTGSSVPTTVDDDDDLTGSSVPTTVDDDVTGGSVPESSIPVASLPGPFTKTYNSAGGSVIVSWSGTAFTLVTVSPTPGFMAEIKHNEWDRVRVEFDNDETEWRIEVRLNDGSIRERITN
ncbi:MAG: hypothetical protein DRJ50_05880, partial [Actinobacteria bacterium]